MDKRESANGGKEAAKDERDSVKGGKERLPKDEGAEK